MSRRIVELDWKERKMERKKGKPVGEPDYYHDLATNVTYALDDPLITNAKEIEEVIQWWNTRIGRRTR